MTPSRRWLAQCLGLLMAVGGGARAQSVALAMKVPALTAGAADMGSLPGSQPMRVTVYLAPGAEKQAALVGFLKDVVTPGSASYHGWLTPAEFASQFGAGADQVARVSAVASAAGLTVEGVSASGLRVELSGTVRQVEAAMAPALHGVQVAGTSYFANTAVPALPKAVAGDVLAVGGLSDLPGQHPLAVGSDAGVAKLEGLAAIGRVVDANAARVVSLSTTACLEDVDAGTQGAIQLALREASAQGITVLAQTGCGARGSAGFPSALSEVTAVAAAPGTTPGTAANLAEPRPGWQVAAGLPADALRHEPDVTVSSLSALAAEMETILAKAPAAADGSPARLGNIDATLYELAVTPGLFTQPDHATAGTWEAATGLGLVDLPMLGRAFPLGIFSDNVSISLTSGYVPHGTAANFSSTVSDTSGKGNGVVPTGTVTFTTGSGVALGSATLVNGTATVAYSQLAGGTYTVMAAYSGDGTYAAANSISTGFTIAGEASQLSGTATSATVGSNVIVTVTDKSGSGVGTPSGTITVTPQGTNDSSTYSGTLSGSGGTATATVSVPATQGGSVVMQVNCASADASFTCYNPISVTAAETKGTPTMTLTVSPNPPVTGTATNFTATVAGLGGKYPTPTGNVVFADNGSTLGSGTLNSGTATFQTSNLVTGTHSFTAAYGGDNNYATASATPGAVASPASATTGTLTVTPNPPVSGSTTTLTDTLSYTLTNSTAPAGTVSFYEDGVLLSTAAVSGGGASYSSTGLSGTATHTFYAVYAGDANYLTSTTPTVATAASGATAATTTTLTVSPNPPVSGTTTTLTATVAPTVASTSTPTGSVSFYEDSALLFTVPVSAGTASVSSTTLSSTTTHSFYAVYSGDTSFKTSTSPSIATSASSATVTTATSLTINPNPPVSGSTTTLTATVGYTGTTAPTGTVAFTQDGTALGTSPVSAGVATLSSTTLSGTVAHSYTAAYSGDATYKASTSSALATKAQAATATTTVTVSSSASTVTTGGTATLSAVITPSSIVNSTAPTGTVTFSSAQGTLCTGTVSSNAASCAATFTLAGAQAISASYGGDTNYGASTSATPAAVTVSAAAVAGVLTVTASPSASVMYGNTVTLSSTLTPTTAVTGGPVGTVTFTLSGAGAATYTAAIVSATGTATVVIPAPTPGTYTVTATCTSTNVTCTTLSATASLTTIKGNTVTTVTASPTSPLAGQTTTLTATVAPATTANAAALAPTGTVTFYINGTATIEPVVNGVATLSTVLTATTGSYITAVYSGDTNWLGSNSSQLVVLLAPIATTSSLSANETTALYTANVVLTVSILVPPTTTNPYPPAPTGTVTFYDLYNGQTVLLGTSSLTQVVPGDSIAQISTTGLMKGTHNITALFGATTTYASSTSTIVINITDYGVSFSPAQLSLTRGAGGAAIATITSYNGFAGQVVLGCTPPGGALMTCSFSPAVITGAGTSVLSVTTTAPTANNIVPQRPGSKATGITLAAASLATMLLALMLPRGRRRRVGSLLAVVAASILAASMGCTQSSTTATTGTGTPSGGTPQGTQLLTISTSGTDGQTTVRHDTQYQVTVQ